MKKNTLKTVLAMLVMVMAFSFTGITAQAASKTKKLTLYVGEKFTYSYIGIGKVKSVKSSKKSVVTAKKKSGKNEMTAKKKGSATVTVKGTRGTFKYKITVKSKPNLKVTLERRADKYVNVKVANKSTMSCDSLKVELSFKNAAGQEVTKETAYIYYLGAKKSAADQVYPYPNNGIDYSKTTYKVIYDRDPDYKYTDYTKKVKYSTSKKNNTVTVKTNISYKKSNSVYAGWTLYFYDAQNNVVGIRDGYNFMSGSSKKYRTQNTEVSMPYEATSYKLVNKRAVLKTYIK
ncbi:MAG: hypothetical protein NC347_13165 [Clostridium sp.]|nr:hypothetical protein [Clostridium sp.]